MAVTQYNFTGDGSTKIYPIAVKIISEDYVKIEINSVPFLDTTKFDIINNSIVFTSAPANSASINVWVADSIESIADLGTTTNVDLVGQNMADINIIASNIEDIKTASSDLVKWTEPFIATAGQTDFISTHVVDKVSVYVNGLRLTYPTDYTTLEKTVTLTTPAEVGDEVMLEGGQATSALPNYVAVTLNTIAEMLAYDPTVANTVIVKDENQGGIFVYNPALSATNNGGTIFNGWVRQYDGAINVKWFGAVGDGITDDTTAVQATLNIAGDIYIPAGSYKFISTLTIKENTNIKCDGILLKAFIGTGIRNTNYNNPVTEDDNIKLYSLKIRQFDTTARGNVIELVNVSNVKIVDLNIVQIATVTATGAWSLYVSGENIDILNPYIDSRAGGIYADGIHVAYVKNLNILGGTVLAGDDAIALWPPQKEWTNSGKNLASENVNISGLILGSEDANIIRLGASSANTEAGDADDAIVFKNVLISNIIDASPSRTTNRAITISDTRSPANITGTHTGIVFSNIMLNNVTGVGAISILGNNDVTNSANYNVWNFTDIVFDSIKFNNNSNGYSVYGGGVQSLLIKDSAMNRTFVATVSAMQLYGLKYLTIRDSLLSSGGVGTTGTGFRIQYTENLELYNTKIQSGGEFRTLTYDSNATIATNLKLMNCWIADSVRGIDNLDANGHDSVVVSNTLIDASVLKMTANALNATTSDIAFVGEIATSTGATGGTGSGGTGNQYVELEIGGIKYKVLHDGTI